MALKSPVAFLFYFIFCFLIYLFNGFDIYFLLHTSVAKLGIIYERTKREGIRILKMHRLARPAHVFRREYTHFR